MSRTVCLAADAMAYPTGGGHLWVYLNWALSLQAAGCRVIWLERVHPQQPPERWVPAARELVDRVRGFGLDAPLCVYRTVEGEPVDEAPAGTMALRDAYSADALVSLRYGLNGDIVRRFRRSALVDIDPGLLQVWTAQGQVALPRYDRYFSIGENMTGPGSRIPDTGHAWTHTPPCVALDAWVSGPPPAGARFTTVTHWYADEWVTDRGDAYCNNKREGFLPYLDLPARTSVPLELAVCLGDDPLERAGLERRGWSIRESSDVSSTPAEYQSYIRGSLGEFSCAKPSCLRLQAAWVSDRTICYLAAGRPVVVQHTGPSRFLPDAGGMFRFRTPDEAVRALETVMGDYAAQSVLARRLAEDYFDGRRVAGRLLDELMG